MEGFREGPTRATQIRLEFERGSAGLTGTCVGQQKWMSPWSACITQARHHSSECSRYVSPQFRLLRRRSPGFRNAQDHAGPTVFRHPHILPSVPFLLGYLGAARWLTRLLIPGWRVHDRVSQPLFRRQPLCRTCAGHIPLTHSPSRARPTASPCWFARLLAPSADQDLV